MIKLMQLLELEVNNPNINIETVLKLWNESIIRFVFSNDNAWKEYQQIITPYYNKYGVFKDTRFDRSDLDVLSSLERNKFYHQLKQLVQRYG